MKVTNAENMINKNNIYDSIIIVFKIKKLYTDKSSSSVASVLRFL